MPMCKVNFVSQFNLIMEYCRENYIHSRERMLIIGLFHCANRVAQSAVNNEWPDDFFPVSNAELADWCDLDKKAIETLRNSLKQRGVIDFVKGSRNKSQPCYKINYLERVGCRILPMKNGNAGGKNAPNNYPNSTTNNSPNNYPNNTSNHAPNSNPSSTTNTPVSTNSNINLNVNVNAKANTEIKSSSIIAAINTEDDDGGDGASPEVLKMAKDAGFELSVSEAREIACLEKQYTAEWMTEAIRACVRAGAPRLAYLETVLRNRANGVGKPSAASRKTVPAQEYEQRDYEASKTLPDWMLKELDAIDKEGYDKPKRSAKPVKLVPAQMYSQREYPDEFVLSKWQEAGLEGECEA